MRCTFCLIIELIVITITQGYQSQKMNSDTTKRTFKIRFVNVWDHPMLKIIFKGWELCQRTCQGRLLESTRTATNFMRCLHPNAHDNDRSVKKQSIKNRKRFNGLAIDQYRGFYSSSRPSQTTLTKIDREKK